MSLDKPDLSSRIASPYAIHEVLAVLNQSNGSRILSLSIEMRAIYILSEPCINTEA
jgi:hypothetical protein